MSDHDLVLFALNDLSLVIPLDAPRGVILTKIFNSAYAVRDT